MIELTFIRAEALKGSRFHNYLQRGHRCQKEILL